MAKKQTEVAAKGRMRFAEWLDVMIGIYYSGPDRVRKFTLGEYLSETIDSLLPDDVTEFLNRPGQR